MHTNNEQAQPVDNTAQHQTSPGRLTSLSRLRDFFSKNLGAELACLGIGIGIGIMLRLPIFPWILPPSATPVIASFAAALIGAGVAGFWAQRALTQGDRDACRAVAKAFREATSEIIILKNNLSVRDADTKTIKDQLTKLDQLTEQAIKRLDLLSTSHSQMRDGKGVAIADAQIALKELKPIVDETRKRVESEESRRPGALATVQSITNVPSFRNWNERLADPFNKPLIALLNAMRELGHPLDNVRDFYTQGT